MRKGGFPDVLNRSTFGILRVAGSLSAATFLISLLAVPCIVTPLTEDYFLRDLARSFSKAGTPPCGGYF